MALWAAAAGAIPGLNTHPAKIGDPGGLIIYCTGWARWIRFRPNGAASLDKLRTATTTPTVLIGGKPATVVFAGLAPQFVGVNQVNIAIPAGTPTGNTVSLQLVVAVSRPVQVWSGGFELIVCREWNPVTIEEMVYTGFEMMRDCRADSPEGWRYFAANYVPLIRKFLTHYAGSTRSWSLSCSRSASPMPPCSNRRDPAPERWFIAQMRQAVLAQIDAPETDIPLDLATVAEALAPLTMVEKQAAWLIP